MKHVVFVLALFFVARAQAGVITALGANVNFQLATSGRSYEIVAPFSARVGYRFSFLDVIGEYSYLRSSTGTEMVSISQSNHEMLLWARKRVRLTSRLRPFIALGAGAHIQTVQTRFGSSVDDDSGVDPEVSGAAGVEFKITPSFALSVEGRGTYGDGYSPKPLLGLASYLSFTF